MVELAKKHWLWIAAVVALALFVRWKWSTPPALIESGVGTRGGSRDRFVGMTQ